MKEKIQKDFIFFAGNGNLGLANSVIRKLGEFIGQAKLQPIEFGTFSDDESSTELPDNDRFAGKKAVFLSSLHKLEFREEALEIIWALKNQYEVSYVIGVFFFLGFRCQDHPEKKSEIYRLKMTISRLKNAGVDEMIVVTPHSEKMAELCMEFGIKFRAVDPSHIFAETISTYIAPDERSLIRVYAPDKGSVPRAIALAKELGSEVMYTSKLRRQDNKVAIVQESEERIEQMTAEFREKYDFSKIHYAHPRDIEGKIIIMVEDEVRTGETARKTADLLKEYQAKSVLFLATHAVLTPGWRKELFSGDYPFDAFILGNTIPRGYGKSTGGKIHDISVGSLVANTAYQALRDLSQS